MIIKPGRVLSVEEIMELQKDSIIEEKTVAPITIEKESGNDKWYLPKLHLNDPSMWDSAPMENRRHLTGKAAEETCLGNCCGVKGLKAGCCKLDTDDLEHVLGPLDEAWIKDFIAYLQKQGINARRHDIVIDWEEGKLIGEKFFTGPQAQVFQSKDSYPMLRFQVTGPRFACKFLNIDSGKCTIYHKRPDMCRNYYCNFIKANFLVRTPSKPNTYQKLR